MNDIEFDRWLETNFQNGVADEFKNSLIQNCQMDEIDMRNLRILLDRGFTERENTLKKSKVTEKKVIRVVLRFYSKFDKKMGKEMKKLYKQNKSKIHFNRFNSNTQRDFLDDDASGGFTSNNFLQDEGHMEIDSVKNYTMYYTTAHEFMHMFERSRNFKSEKLAEANSRFIELLLGDYLQKRGIISSSDRDSHASVNNNTAYFWARKINDGVNLLRLMEERATSLNSERQNGISDRYVLDKEVVRAFLDRECSGDKGKLIAIVNGIYGDIKRGGSDSLQNKKRFINGTVVSNLLYEIYQNNPKEFPRIYNEALTTENIEYKDFIGTIQANALREVKALPSEIQYLDSIRVSPFTMESNRRLNQEHSKQKVQESQHIDTEDDFYNH